MLSLGDAGGMTFGRCQGLDLMGDTSLYIGQLIVHV